MSPGKILLGVKDKTARINGPQKLRPLPVFHGSPKKWGMSTTKVPAKRKKKETSPARAARLEKRRDARQRKKEESERPNIIVAIDLGCTYTGVAFVAADYDGSQVQVINDWPGRNVMEKVPTRIAYQYENGELQQDTYGYDIQQGTKSYGWFKLRLDENTKPTQYDDPILLQSAGLGIGDLPPGKDVVDITADFLTLIKMKTFDFLEARLGKLMVEETAKTFYLTTPAVWSYRARDFTRQAAKIAGLGTGLNTLGVEDKLYIIDEPEAAAIAAIKTTVDQLPRAHPFKVDQGIIVADLGGGTVDLVSYKIVSLRPLEIDELCIGIGAKCGGTAVDRAFHALMEERYGQAFTSLAAAKTGPGSKFMDMFETAKCIFTVDKGRTWEMPLKMPHLLDEVSEPFQYDVEEDTVILTSDDMESLFAVPVGHSLALVHEQIRLIKEAKMPFPEAIILCGGLGSSPYVKSKFEEFCKGWGKSLQVIQPLQPWSVVCRGAALGGLEDSAVLSRRSRASYGFVVHEDFRAGRHLEEDAFTDDIFGKRAMNQMFWAVEKNEKLKPGEPKKRTCTYTVPPHITELTQQEILCQCNEDLPPTRLNSSVYEVGTIAIDLTGHLEGERNKATRSSSFDVDEEAIVIELDLVYSLGTDKGIMEVSAMSKKKEVGKASIDWDTNSTWQLDKQVKHEDTT